MKCTKCNHEYDDSLAACPLCGEPAPVRSSTAEPHTHTEPHQFTPARSVAEVPQVIATPETSGAAPLVLGILSLFIPFIGIVLGIIAIVMGSSQRQANPPGTAHHALGQAGWVLGIVGLVFQALLIVWFFVVIGFAMNAFQDVISYAPYRYDIF